MTLVDAGPLVALIDRTEQDHAPCVQALNTLTPPLLTTWPVIAEATYLLGDAAGWSGQEQLWRLLLRGTIQVAALPDDALEQMHEQMDRYKDTPMDLADASLVVVAEASGAQRVFTLDSDFRVYRLSGKRAFDIVP